MRPFHAMSRGTPTLTDSSRAMSHSTLARSSRLCAGHRFGDGEVAIGAVRNHALPWLEMDLHPIDLHGDDIGLERYEVRDAAHLGIGVSIRPGCVRCDTDCVIPEQP